MKRTFELRVVALVAAVAALLGGLIFAWFRGFDSDSDDRSVIIVRSGSVELELKSADWEYESTTSQKNAYPVEPNGADVKGYQVTFDKADIKGAAGCPQVPLVADSIDFEYHPQSAGSETVTVTTRQNGGNTEPFVKAPANLAIDTGNKKKMKHGASGGSIVSATVHYGGLDQVCTPNGGKFGKDIAIKPLR